ncbi:PTS sugar transporter subunit IIB [Alkalicella caledoniensis]|uniref:PTS sugar transporter subunit IIB n=1 Tax=Alkalicella caledoniensis TaxID=2731377 RepID=A0A7G9WAX5_ALKCA|nr:PTS sugar transporter subunit IIB [Alkalicella caledoniensis]QNO15837.1 PTS sugar transporter subunit IIB [Alkalicella caledoniensis]
MKILVACGSGLGSSFMMEMNVVKVLKELGVENFEVDHCDLSSAATIKADIYIGTRDIASNLTSLGDTISLNSMIDLNELREKLEGMLKQKGLL